MVSDEVTDLRTGILLAEELEQLLNNPDTRIRLAWTEIVTGGVVYQDPTTYRAGARLARAIRARDGHCRFPSCRTFADRCQLDHVIRAPGGPTDLTNLQSLCTTPHGFKHHAGWTSSMTAEGVCTWTFADGTRAHHPSPGVAT